MLRIVVLNYKSQYCTNAGRGFSPFWGLKPLLTVNEAFILCIVKFLAPAVLVACIWVLLFGTNVGASSSSQTGSAVSSVTRLNLSGRKINGEYVGYTLHLPTLWSGGHLTAERERTAADSGVLEKVNFYYMPQDKTIRRVFLMSFYVYDKRFWRDALTLHKILETQDYVFATAHAQINHLSGVTDRAIFKRFMADAANYEYIADFIEIPPGQSVVPNNTVTVNGTALQAKVTRDSQNRALVPLRETCEALGYRVAWLEADKAVSISKDGFYYLLSPVGRGYAPIIIGGKAYVPSVFFIQILGANVVIDDSNNIFVNG